MILKKPALILLCAVLSVFGCSKDDPIGLTSKYYILTNVHDQDKSKDYVTFTTCEMPAFSVAKSTNRTEFNYFDGDLYCDIVGDDNSLYAARFRCDTIDVIDYKRFSVTKKIPFTHSQSLYKKHLTVTKNKLFVATAGFTSSNEGISYVMAIDLENIEKIDSIPVMQNSEIWAITSINDKLFVSVGDYSPHAQIIVYDAQTYDSLGAIDLPGKCSELYNDGKNNVLAMTYSKLSFIDSNTFSIVSTKETFGQSLTDSFSAYFNCNNSYAYNQSDNILYYAQAAPQPATAPYILSSYNLTTNKITVVDNKFIGASTISYDEKQELILVGIGSKVVMYKTNGEVYGEFSTGNQVNKIVVRYAF